MKIEFIADKVQVQTGKKVDNSATVTFVVGEYQRKNLKDLIDIEDGNYKVTVEKYDG